jgi:hypothetical protein
VDDPDRHRDADAGHRGGITSGQTASDPRERDDRAEEPQEEDQTPGHPQRRESRHKRRERLQTATRADQDTEPAEPTRHPAAEHRDGECPDPGAFEDVSGAVVEHVVLSEQGHHRPHIATRCVNEAGHHRP